MSKPADMLVLRKKMIKVVFAKIKSVCVVSSHFSWLNTGCSLADQTGSFHFSSRADTIVGSIYLSI